MSEPRRPLPGECWRSPEYHARIKGLPLLLLEGRAAQWGVLFEGPGTGLLAMRGWWFLRDFAPCQEHAPETES